MAAVYAALAGYDPRGADLRPRVSGRPARRARDGHRGAAHQAAGQLLLRRRRRARRGGGARGRRRSRLAWAQTSSRWSCPACRGARGGDEDHLGRGAGHAPGSPRRRAGVVRRGRPPPPAVGRRGSLGRRPRSAVQTGREWRRMLDGVFEESTRSSRRCPGRRAARGRLRDDRDDAEAHHPHGWSLAGIPALAVPCGFSPEGMPIGIAAPAWRADALPDRRRLPARDRLAPARAAARDRSGGGVTGRRRPAATDEAYAPL